MPDPDIQQLIEMQRQSNELQRQMLTELATTRAAQGGGSGAGGLSAGNGGPSAGHTFVAAQAQADRLLSGSWSTLGWSQAYSSTYHSTFGGDLATMLGFQRAPETLTQGEFRGLASQSMAARVGSAMTGFIAPAYNARTNALAEEINLNSARFIRAGNSQAGSLGVGFGFDASRSISRFVQNEALSDLRMNGRDYNTVTSLGMQSGQFDQVQSADDFKSKVKELASATGDLTRALHMSVNEIGTAMGNLRQAGVLGVGQQRGVLMQLGGAAMAAGMSVPEMLGVAGNIGQAGLQFGLAATTTMPAAASQMATLRAMSQAGIVSPQVMAMGGGASAITGNILNAQMAYAGSAGGYLSFMGGGAGAGSNTFGSMMGGIGALGVGSVEGSMTFGYDRIKNLSNMTPQQLAALTRNRIETNLGAMGMTDFTSHAAQGAAFQQALGMGMDQAAAMAYVSQEFTPAGRLASDRAEMFQARATNARERAIATDLSDIPTTWQGKWQQAQRSVESGLASWQNAGSSMVDRIMGINAASIDQQNVTSTLLGTRVGGTTSLSDYYKYVQGATPRGRGTRSVSLGDSSSIPAGLAGGAGIALTGAAISAFAPGGQPLAAGLAIAGAGMYGLSMLAGANSTTSVPQQISDDLINLQRITATKSAPSEAVKHMVENQILKGASYEKLSAQQNYSGMNAAAATNFNSLVRQTMAENGMANTTESYSNVVQSLQITGHTIGLNAMTITDSAGVSSEQSASKTDFFSGLSSSVAADLAKPGAREILAKFIDVRGDMNAPSVRKIRDAAMGVLGNDYDDFVKRMSARVTQSGLGIFGDGLGDARHSINMTEVSAALRGEDRNMAVQNVSSAVTAAQDVFRTKAGGLGLNAADSASLASDIGSVSNSNTFGDLIGNHNSQFYKLAKAHKLSQGAFDATVLEDDTSFDKLSAQEIADKYHADPADIAKYRKDPKFKRALESSMITDAQDVQKQQEEAMPLKVANLLQQATSALERINGTPATPVKQ